MFCKQCGNQLNDGALFCPKCGYKIGSGTARSNETQPVKTDTSVSAVSVEKPAKSENTETSDLPKKKSKRKIIIPVAGVVCLLVVVGLIISSSSRKKVSSNIVNEYDYEKPLQTENGDEAYNEHSSTSDSNEDQNDDSSNIADNDIGEFTIMVYIIGSDLESGGDGGIDYGGAATRDLIEMADASWGKDVNLLLETGGTKEWDNDVISPNSIQRHEIRDGKFYTLEELPLEQMSSISALSDYIKWGTTNYPAKKYGLILWDHGGGLLGGYGKDELYEKHSMSIPEISSAIKNTNIKFEFIGFDACLMASFESAYALKDCANYLVASEESESNIGWYYTDWLNSLGKNPEMSMEELGRNIIDGMIGDNQDFIEDAKSRGRTREKMSTLSLIDLKKMPEVYDAWLSYLKEMKMSLNQGEFAEQTVARVKSRTYGDVKYTDSETGEDYESHADMLDMLDFIDKTALPGSFDLKNTIRSCVVYCNSDISGSNGLSVYMPYYLPRLYTERAIPLLKDIGFDDEYFDYFNTFCSYLAAGNTDYDFEPTEEVDDAEITEITIPDYIEFKDIDGKMGIPLTWDQWGETSSMAIEAGDVITDVKNADGKTVTVISSYGERIDNPPILQDGTLQAEGDVVITVLYSPDSGDVIVPYTFVADCRYDNTTLYQLGYVPAILNNEKRIYIVTDSVFNSLDDYSFEVQGYILENEGGSDLRNLKSFSKGDVITVNPYYYEMGEKADSRHVLSGLSDSITVGDGGVKGRLSGFGEEHKGDKSRCFRYIITDIYNNKHYTSWLYY